MFHHENLKFDTTFENLECLVISCDRLPHEETNRLLGDDFLQHFPKLKILLTDNLKPIDHSNLERQKRKFNLNELKCVRYELTEDFDHANWPKYVQHREQLRCWPTISCANFGQLINCQMPLHYLQDCYLNLSCLVVGKVPDQLPLVEFLKSVRINTLALANEFNLVQNFFDEIAQFLTVRRLNLFESTLNRLNDLHFLTKLNFNSLHLYFERLPREVISTVLKKPACHDLQVRNYHSEAEWSELPDGFNIPDTEFVHMVAKRIDDFYCISCGFKSDRDPNFSDALIASFLSHLENPPDFSQSNGPYFPVDAE